LFVIIWNKEKKLHTPLATKAPDTPDAPDAPVRIFDSVLAGSPLRGFYPPKSYPTFSIFQLFNNSLLLLLIIFISNL
jgi:hypothetical protein